VYKWILLFLCMIPFNANAQIRYEYGEWHFFSEDYYQSRSYRQKQRQRLKRQEREHRRQRREVSVPPPQVREIRTQLKPGTVYISTKNLMLYYVISSRQAIAYPVALGREGFEWQGTESVSAVKRWPDWRPPKEMRMRDPTLPVLVPGGPQNPLGIAAIYLGDTLYRIHGTNEPRSIGKRVSSGCIRMHNKHVLDLIKRIEIGTKVIVE